MINTKNTKVPGPVRAGIALLIVGAILGGAGTISNKDSSIINPFVNSHCKCRSITEYFIS